MKLRKAYLCIDCDEIFEVEGKTNPECPSCTSRSYAPIAGWITSQDFADRMNAMESGKRRVPAVIDLIADKRTGEVHRYELPWFEDEPELVKRARRAGL